MNYAGVFFVIKTWTWQKTTSPPLKEDRFIQFVPAAGKQRTSCCFSLQFEVPALNADVSLRTQSFVRKITWREAQQILQNETGRWNVIPSPPPAPLPFYLKTCMNHLRYIYIYIFYRGASFRQPQNELGTSWQKKKKPKWVKRCPCSQHSQNLQSQPD